MSAGRRVIYFLRANLFSFTFVIMTTLTVDIENEKDLPVLKEILSRFGLNYKVNQEPVMNKEEEKLYKRLKQSFSEIKDWDAGKVKLQDAKEAVREIEAELKHGI